MKAINYVPAIGLMIILAACNNTSQKPESKIHFFDGTFEKALVKAKKENKLVFLDAYANWCGPCRKMDRVVYSDQRVGDVFNAKYVSFKLNVDNKKDSKIAQRYGVTVLPTLMILDADGNVLKQITGYHSPDEFLQFAE